MKISQSFSADFAASSFTRPVRDRSLADII